MESNTPVTDKATPVLAAAQGRLDQLKADLDARTTRAAKRLSAAVGELRAQSRTLKAQERKVRAVKKTKEQQLKAMVQSEFCYNRRIDNLRDQLFQLSLLSQEIKAQSLEVRVMILDGDLDLYEVLEIRGMLRSLMDPAEEAALDQDGD
ncbi:hypothetical protein BT67DRAFT_290099 [Trichocladium antarcticum]|uniref:Uncharacterized protein n=1 Tax=Trichocladium antarcticum TaxID=1450529 RepID=A0AAN6ULZ2_9PEZI|nr:hypothetical protein BT67DRAFT_290099 [Trichocladium antarcticum]